MEKEIAIHKLMAMVNDLELGDKFEGRAEIIRAINERKKFLVQHKCNDNLPRLMVKESEADIRDAVR